MGRFLGGIFGNTVPNSTTATDTSGVFNMSDAYYMKQEGGWVYASGLEATGGIISDYDVGADKWRAHIFHSPGSFDVSALGQLDNNVEYLIVAGGGGGGANTPGGSYHGAGGGGGAGGVVTNMPGVVTADNTSLSAPRGPQPVAVANYSITVGTGGAGANGSNNSARQNGGDSIAFGLTAVGGGGGSNNGSNGTSAAAGGSGGGGGRENTTAGAATYNTNPTRQGYPGATGNSGGSNGRGGGGGGAGAAGQNESSATNGGLGVQVLIAGPTGGGIGYPGPNGQGGWFAGGGGGGGSGNTAPGGSGGGGGPLASPYAGGGYGAGSVNDANEASGYNAKAFSGGGGGGGASMNTTPAYSWGGEGAGGIVVVRYKIASVQTGSAKATGGAISYYNGRAIHTFLTPGSFENTSGSPLAIDYVLVGGGGAGMNDVGAGGGAGGVLTNIPGMMPATTSISDVQSGAPHALTISIGLGGQGRRSYNAKVQARNDGGDTTMSGTGINVTAIGGGGAAACNGPGESADGAAGLYSGRPGGSGGGGRYNRTPGAGGTGTAGQGHDGATTSGGGGGAGAVGQVPGGGNPNGHGGMGVQLPAIFQNPKETVGAPGPGGSGFWIAGGGGGGYYNGRGGAFDGTAAIPGGPYAGAGGGGANQGGNGLDGTGSGGAGAQSQAAGTDYGGSGGSGIVLISYPV